MLPAWVHIKSTAYKPGHCIVAFSKEKRTMNNWSYTFVQFSFIKQSSSSWEFDPPWTGFYLQCVHKFGDLRKFFSGFSCSPLPLPSTSNKPFPHPEMALPVQLLLLKSPAKSWPLWKLHPTPMESLHWLILDTECPVNPESHNLEEKHIMKQQSKGRFSVHIALHLMVTEDWGKMR